MNVEERFNALIDALNAGEGTAEERDRWKADAEALARKNFREIAHLMHLLVQVDRAYKRKDSETQVIVLFARQDGEE